MPVRKTAAIIATSIAAVLAELLDRRRGADLRRPLPDPEVRREQRQARRGARRQHVGRHPRRRKTTSPRSNPTAASKNLNWKESKAPPGSPSARKGGCGSPRSTRSPPSTSPTRRRRPKRRRSPPSRRAIRSSPVPMARCGLRQPKTSSTSRLRIRPKTAPSTSPNSHRRTSTLPARCWPSRIRTTAAS